MQSEVRVFEGPQRIAGIETHADKIAPRFFHQRLQLARLHVARMVLDGDLDVGVHGLRPNVAEHLTVLSIWRSMGPGWRSSELPRTARTMRDPTIFAEAIMRVSCSSAVPSFGSNIFEVGQMDFIPISTSMPSFSAYCRTWRRFAGSRPPMKRTSEK